MGFLFLLGGIIGLLSCGVIGVSFFRHYRNSAFSKSVHRLGLLFFVTLLFSILSFSWSFGFLTFTGNDFVYIYAALVFVQTVILFSTLQFFIEGKETRYFLLLYVLSGISLFFSFSSFASLLIVISSFLMLTLFLIFMLESRTHKLAGAFGVGYGLVSLLSSVMLLFGFSYSYFLAVISYLIFLVFLFLFTRDIHKYSFHLLRSRLKQNYLLLFFRYFIFVIILTTIVLFATIGIHEFGHVLYAKWTGCDYQTVIFEEGQYAYTSVFCDDASGRTIALLFGPLLPIVLSVLLFILGGRFIREVALLIFGFNLLASYRDFMELGFSLSITIASTIAGLIFLLLGIVYLSRFRIDEQVLSHFE